jgi:enoyl-CoA hydratase
MNIAGLFERRSLLKAAAALGGLSALSGGATVAHADGQSSGAGIEAPSDQVKMDDIPLSSGTKVTVERRGQIVLIGINRPYIHNRIDPETFVGLCAISRSNSAGPLTVGSTPLPDPPPTY